MEKNKPSVVIIGAGFTGLAAGYELSRNGFAVTILEKEDQIGGLAGTFDIEGQPLECFYHHWFNNDMYIIQLVHELGLDEYLDHSPTKTGIYLNKNFYKLSSPLDVLRFKPLSIADRFRLGLLILKARRIKDWRPLESQTAEEWLIESCGKNVYHVIWEPLLRGKFGPYASEISAVWFWSKLILRGGSRNKMGTETLVYYRNSFTALANELAKEIRSAGGQIKTGISADKLVIRDGCIAGVSTPNGTIEASAVIATPAPSIVAGIIDGDFWSDYQNKLNRIRYLANICLVLELKESLSDIYWLNVNEPEFPFIGVIEHTNFQLKETCGNRHIIYLSKYLTETSELYRMDNNQVFEFAISHIQGMFPKFDRSWVYRHHVWKARYAQPVVTCNYSQIIPAYESPIPGLYLCNMAQIYPEDRGTNYAVREGRKIGQLVNQKLKTIQHDPDLKG